MKGQKHARALTSGNKKQITVLACSNAAGYMLPPLVIFGRKVLNLDLTVGEVPGTCYGLSDNGWMDGEIFENWFTHHFLVHAPSPRPLLLLLDGHSTHYNPGFVRRAAHEEVIVFCFPPNTTHLTQPLDKGAFGPLKTYWNQECQTYMRKNPGKVLNQYNFMSVFSQAWYRAMTIPNLISAFRTTGVYPLNRHAVKVTDTAKSTFDGRSLAEATGLAFIPLYSPAHRSRPRLSPAHTPEEPTQAAFTEEEHARFTQRFEEGYDIFTDDRYNFWLQVYHSSPPPVSPSGLNDSSPMESLLDVSDASLSHSPNLLLRDIPKPESILKKFLPHPRQKMAKPPSYEKMSAKVLTSAECMKQMEEKERMKQKKQEEKERRKDEREKRKAEREKQKAEREKQKAEKKKTKGMVIIQTWCVCVHACECVCL